MAKIAASIATISPVDRLGDLRAEIERMKEVEAFLIAEVKAMGAGAHEGTAFRATVSEVADRKALDAKAAEAKLRELGVDGRWFSKNMRTSRGYTTVRIAALKA